MSPENQNLRRIAFAASIVVCVVILVVLVTRIAFYGPDTGETALVSSTLAALLALAGVHLWK